MVDKRGPGTRAKDLFKSLLTPEQLEQYTTSGVIDVQGGATGTVYRIRAVCPVTNIFDRKNRSHYCIYMMSDHLGHSIPPYDQLVAQLLHIKYNERGFLRTAVRGTYPEYYNI